MHWKPTHFCWIQSRISKEDFSSDDANFLSYKILSFNWLDPGQKHKDKPTSQTKVVIDWNVWLPPLIDFKTVQRREGNLSIFANSLFESSFFLNRKWNETDLICSFPDTLHDKIQNWNQTGRDTFIMTY